ncbi:MAG: hypothetical protein HQK96_05950 [Nitrospirae bacterium]|nr:hypothetical protein [Nitrospirota bacterium]
MKLFIVFDKTIDIDAIDLRGIDSAELFPLTGDSNVTKKIESALSETLGKDGSVTTINSAGMVHAEVDFIVESISEWSSSLGLQQVEGKTLREWFALPDRRISTWWFGAIAEKNTFKTNLFFKLAQSNATQKAIVSSACNRCLISLTDKDIAEAAALAAVKSGVGYDVISPERFTRNSIIQSLTSSPVIAGLLRWLDFAKRGVLARRYMGDLLRRLPDKPSVLFVTYFPSVDREKASNGVFENKYAKSLQQKMKALDITILWGAMYVAINNYTFREAIALARGFVQHGERFFFVEEFASMSILFEALCLWLRQIALSKYLFRFIKKAILKPPLNAENTGIALSLWKESFCGIPAIEGILYYLTYERLFREVPNISKCIYYSEMHPWEMALNAAKPRQLCSVGFLHTTLSKRDLYHLKDAGDFTGEFKCPTPDVLACNGSHCSELLEARGYSNVQTLEAVRQIYLEDILKTPPKPVNQRPVLLIAGTIDRAETASLLTLIDSARDELPSVTIWFKGHPSMPLEGLFRELGINAGEKNYTIKHGDITDYLGESFAVIVASSTVALEAVAYGAEVIIPFFPNCMNTNPLCDFSGFYHRVTSKDELVITVKKLLGGITLHTISQYRELITNYWLFDSNLTRWTELLKR